MGLIGYILGSYRDKGKWKLLLRVLGVWGLRSLRALRLGKGSSTRVF